jgi:hypothetical protein
VVIILGTAVSPQLKIIVELTLSNAAMDASMVEEFESYKSGFGTDHNANNITLGIFCRLRDEETEALIAQVDDFVVRDRLRQIKHEAKPQCGELIVDAMMPMINFGWHIAESLKVFPMFPPKKISSAKLNCQTQSGKAARAAISCDAFPDTTLGAVLLGERFVTPEEVEAMFQAMMQAERLAERLAERSRAAHMHELHCRGLRKINPLLIGSSAYCSMCLCTVASHYACASCATGRVCAACFPQGMGPRINVVDTEAWYQCPTCLQKFFTFETTTPQTTPDNSFVGADF